MADRSDRLPPYRRPEGEEDLFTPAAGVRYPVQPVPPPGAQSAGGSAEQTQPARPMSRREAREAARRGRAPAPQPADPPQAQPRQWWEEQPAQQDAPAGRQDAPVGYQAPDAGQQWDEQLWSGTSWQAAGTAPATDAPTTGAAATGVPVASAAAAAPAFAAPPYAGPDDGYPDAPHHPYTPHHPDAQDAPAAPSAPEPHGLRGRWSAFVDRVTDVSTGRRWTMPLAAALLAAWSATVFADLGGLLGVVTVTLAATAPLVSVLAIPVATLSVRRRRWESVVVTVAAALLPWYFVLGYATAEPPPTKQGVPVTVLVVNAHAGKAEAADIVAAVRTHKVDVLVVTELSRRLSHDLAEARLGSYVEPRWFAVDDVPERGLGVWSRLEVQDPTLVPGTTWPAVSVTVDTRSGDLEVVAGHAVPPVPNAVDRWQGDLDALKAATRGQDHVLLVGTFNASPWHAQYRHLLGRRFVDAADALGRGLRPTWPTWTPLPLVPMDSAIVGRDIRAEAADTVPVNGTDHRALLVTVQVPGDVAPGD